jgi:N-methylhydantoinase A/oxoprolinase/acetone carboxylase beta subunit
MSGIIHNIMTFYEMRAKALGILVANTEKALEESASERIPEEQAAMLERFVQDLARDVNDMTTRFWFLKEREQMSDYQTGKMTDFVNFTKTLSRDVRSLLSRFQEAHDRTFEEQLDKEIKRVESQMKRRLREFDSAFNETNGTVKSSVSKFVCGTLGSVGKLLKSTPLAGKGKFDVNTANRGREKQELQIR